MQRRNRDPERAAWWRGTKAVRQGAPGPDKCLPCLRSIRRSSKNRSCIERRWICKRSGLLNRRCGTTEKVNAPMDDINCVPLSARPSLEPRRKSWSFCADHQSMHPLRLRSPSKAGLHRSAEEPNEPAARIAGRPERTTHRPQVPPPVKGARARPSGSDA